MEKANITIVGAGIVGLAIAEVLCQEYSNIIILEKNASFGQETSSHNSEVIHAGIYYPLASLKAKLCVEGKELLYQYCQEHNVRCKKLGKLIIATERSDIERLEDLCQQGIGNGVTDLKIITKEEVKKREPHIEAVAAIDSPSTGILDVMELMSCFVSEAKSRGVKIIYAAELERVEKDQHGFTLSIKDACEGMSRFSTQILINAAGLNADTVSSMAGVNNQEYKIKYCKGSYFTVGNAKGKNISHLIYPLPAAKSVSLGIHTALDVGGNLRLGPDAEYVDTIDYFVDASKRNKFYESVCSFLPFISEEDLTPDICGFRAKLQGQGEPFRDFIIHDETDNGAKGFINLVGIDSPGLTCALSIAYVVKKLVKPYF